MKYSVDFKDVKNASYFFDSNDSPYKIEKKLGELFQKMEFVKTFDIKLKVDKDGLYSFYKDAVIVDLTINNSLYLAHLLEEDEKIEDIVRSWVPNNFDLRFNISHDDV